MSERECRREGGREITKALFPFFSSFCLGKVSEREERERRGEGEDPLLSCKLTK